MNSRSHRNYTSEDKIFQALDEMNKGVKVVDICSKYNISKRTFYYWRSNYVNVIPVYFRNRYYSSIADFLEREGWSFSIYNIRTKLKQLNTNKIEDILPLFKFILNEKPYRSVREAYDSVKDDIKVPYREFALRFRKTKSLDEAVRFCSLDSITHINTENNFVKPTKSVSSLSDLAFFDERDKNDYNRQMKDIF